MKLVQAFTAQQEVLRPRSVNQGCSVSSQTPKLVVQVEPIAPETLQSQLTVQQRTIVRAQVSSLPALRANTVLRDPRVHSFVRKDSTVLHQLKNCFVIK